MWLSGSAPPARLASTGNILSLYRTSLHGLGRQLAPRLSAISLQPRVAVPTLSLKIFCGGTSRATVDGYANRAGRTDPIKSAQGRGG